MKKLALLISTDDWSKMDDYQDFLSQNDKAVWRTRGRHKQSTLNQLPFPLNLYFYHKNVVRYRARCTGIFRAIKWALEEVPPAFRADKADYSMFIQIDSLSRIDDLPITQFPKWDNPKECFDKGLPVMVRVVDLPEVN